jgi:hypothetical protein
MYNSNIYNIKICDATDIGKLKEFIDRHWKKGHALVVSQVLLDFQHYEKETDTYNYIIAVNKISDEIDGLIGFIPTHHYDRNLAVEKDYWGAIWKIRTDVNNEEIKTLGLYLLESFKEATAFSTFGAIGISKVAKKIYKALKYDIGILNQYYMLNREKTTFVIANVVDNTVPKNTQVGGSNFRISEIESLEGVTPLECEYSPKKSITYLVNRYLKHPIYKYKFLGIYNGHDLKTILVTRTIHVNNARVIRIVDMLGNINLLPNLFDQLQARLIDEDAEYIDFVNYGISEDLFLQLGFTKLIVDGNTTIPNYFEPFEKANIEIEFASKSTKPYIIFKGDSDQDRPNIIL